ncbi:MAG: hypothetical protein LR015_04675 [Verrucomicrobia bacterium]|nr:hypothetical protein [Verrucomicrobiota bacterium]
MLLKALRELSHYQQALLIIYGLKAHGPKERGELIAYIDAVCADWALPTDKFNILYLEV